MSSYPVDTIAGPDDWKKRQAIREKALQARLKSLPQDNIIVKSIKEDKKEENDYEVKDSQWEVVSKLYHESRDLFMEGDKSFKEVVKGLSEALSSLRK